MTDTATTTIESTTTEAPSGRSIEEAAAEVFGVDAAAPVTETAEPAAKVEEKAPAPKEERAATRIAAAKKAEQKAAVERQSLRAEQEKLAKRTAELDALEKKIRLVESDPVKFFEEFKGDPKKFLEQLAGEHRPENVAVKKVTQVEAELARLKAELAQREASAQESVARAQSDQRWHQVNAAFTEFVGENADVYPHLTQEYTEEQVPQLIMSVLHEVIGHDANGNPITRNEQYRRQFGDYPDKEVVADYLELLAKQRIEARGKSAWRKRGDSAVSASQASGQNKQVPTVKGTSPRTLTSRDASQRAAPPQAWTQEWADQESIRLLEQGYRNKTG